MFAIFATKITLMLSIIKCSITLTDLLDFAQPTRNNQEQKPKYPKFLSSKYSLLEGVLMDNLRAIHNLRFYGAAIKHNFDENSTDWYVAQPKKDSNAANNKYDEYMLGYSLCRFFPSFDGFISISANYPANIKKLFYSKKDTARNDLKFLAEILFCTVYKVHSNFESFNSGCSLEIFYDNKSVSSTVINYEQSFSDSDKYYIDVVKHTFNGILKYNGADDVIFCPRVIIKTYICFYLENVEEIKTFYDHFENIKNLCGINEEEDTENDKIMCELLEIVDLQEKCFPYRKNDTAKTKNIPQYFSKKGNSEELKAYFGPEKDGFPNCIEISLYYLINCILWDSDNKKYIVPGGNEDCEIRKIFKNDHLKRIPDFEETKRWHELIEDLDNGAYARENGGQQIAGYELTRDKIFYLIKKTKVINGKNIEYHNELMPGLVNSFKVIGTVMGLQEQFMKEFDKILVNADKVYVKDLKTCILNIITLIVGKQHADNFIIDFYGPEKESNVILDDDSEIVYSDVHTLKDLFCKLCITRLYPKEKLKVQYIFGLTTTHSTFEVKNIENENFQKFSLDKYESESFKKFIEQNIMGNLFIKRFSQYFESEALESLTPINSQSISLHLVGQKLEYNDETASILKKIAKFGEKNVDKKVDAEKICCNVLKSMPILSRWDVSCYFILPAYDFRYQLKNIFTSDFKDKIINEIFGRKTTFDFIKSQNNLSREFFGKIIETYSGMITEVERIKESNKKVAQKNRINVKTIQPVIYFETMLNKMMINISLEIENYLKPENVLTYLKCFRNEYVVLFKIFTGVYLLYFDNRKNLEKLTDQDIYFWLNLLEYENEHNLEHLFDKNVSGNDTYRNAKGFMSYYYLIWITIELDTDISDLVRIAKISEFDEFYFHIFYKTVLELERILFGRNSDLLILADFAKNFKDKKEQYLIYTGKIISNSLIEIFNTDLHKKCQGKSPFSDEWLIRLNKAKTLITLVNSINFKLNNDVIKNILNTIRLRFEDITCIKQFFKSMHVGIESSEFVAVLSIIDCILECISKNDLIDFTEVRNICEEFFNLHKSEINTICEENCIKDDDKDLNLLKLMESKEFVSLKIKINEIIKKVLENCNDQVSA